MLGRSVRPISRLRPLIVIVLGLNHADASVTLQPARLHLEHILHALLSYLLGAIVLATTINLVSGLVR